MLVIRLNANMNGLQVYIAVVIKQSLDEVEHELSEPRSVLSAEAEG